MTAVAAPRTDPSYRPFFPAVAPVAPGCPAPLAPDAVALASRLRQRDLSCEEAVRDALERVGRDDGQYSCFLGLCADRAVEKAREADRRLSGLAADEARHAFPFLGVPAAVKDNLCLEGVRTTCGSRMLSSYVPPYTATTVSRLEALGAVVIGKLNMDEFAMGASSETSFLGPVRNPHATDRVAGGSSGGSAAALAAGFVPLSLGSDTGGSIRQPAAFCGVFGLKPTYGAMSRYGLVAYASSLDQPGPLARSLRDLSVLFPGLVGRDPRDATSRAPSPPPVPDAPRAGVPEEYLAASTHPALRAAVSEAVRRLEAAGIPVLPLSLPATRLCVPAYYILASAEASSNLSRFDGVRYGHRSAAGETLAERCAASRTEGFGLEVRRRILLGTFVLSAGYQDQYYGRAQKAREAIREEFRRAFGTVDFLVTPATPEPAFRIGEKITDPIAMYSQDICTVGPSLAGLPALSVPAGHTAEGLPVGIQLIGPAWSEAFLLAMAQRLAEVPA